MNPNAGQRNSLIYFIALTISFFAALAAIAYTIFFLQEVSGNQSIWPMPGLATVDWTLLGLMGFIAVARSLRGSRLNWVFISWSVTGAFIPLIILGAFSIGTAMLILFLAFLASTILLNVLVSRAWLAGIGFLLVGAITNLVIFLALGGLATLATP